MVGVGGRQPLGDRAHGRLELDGRLAIVGRLTAHAEQRAGRIEQAPDRGRHGRVQPALDHGVAHLGLIAQRQQRIGGAGMLQQVELVQDAVGHAQRVAHRRGAAGHGHIGEIGETLVGLLVGESRTSPPHTRPSAP